MKLLFNENAPRVLVEECRSAGVDATWMREIGPGATDIAVLAKSNAEKRVCVTFDKDFGELAAKGAAGACGVVLLRVPPPRTADAARRIVSILKSRTDWAQNFSVIEPGRLRMRRIDGASGE